MIILKVPDMSCNHCVRAIETVVRAVDPAASVAADLARHVVTIGSEADQAALRRAMADAGYDSETLAG